MSSLPPLFLDLAIILITAGVVTVVFKWLRQPLVLGYIVSGFLIGPYVTWFPAITDETNVHVWSDIGIVFLMFALGLEFSIKKLKKVGGTGAITALTELFVMFLIGSSVGRLLGFTEMECIFLGCMLSISSTTIIIKSFDDLKLKQQKFTNTVTAVLVVEDLVAVLLLVLLSTLSVSRSFNGGELAMSLLKLVFFLMIWFLFGIFFIPSFLRWMRRFMTEETLCIVAVGLCFGMVVTASYAGFSTALGAFVMGAILAETIEADAIHRIITPIKNLFGAVFFVSVGMLVNPEVLVKYIGPILVIAATIVVFKSMAATLGVLLSGKPLKTAMQSGFCFCQIGEFSFIIAGLGLSFGVIGPNLYPIIVSVSIITTFVTPYMIKAGLPAYEWLNPRIPSKMKDAMERYATFSSGGTGHESLVNKFIRRQVSSILIYGVILTVIAILSFTLLQPFLLRTFGNADIDERWANLLGATATLFLMMPFLWAMVRNISRERLRKMHATYHGSQVVVIPLIILRIGVALFFVGLVLARYVHLAVGFILVLTLMVILFVISSRRATNAYLRLEEHFVSNFNQRQAQNSFRIPQSMEQVFSMERMVITPFSAFVGQTLRQADLRSRFRLSVVTIERGNTIINLPGSEEQMMPMDKVTVIGTEEDLAHFRTEAEVEPEMLIRDHSDNEINIYRYKVIADGPLQGRNLIQADLRNRFNGMVIAIERDQQYMLNPKADTVFKENDVVWFVSPDEITLSRFIKEN
ncbi:MAG: cation:proton antiporter [Bacteroidales bacterium]|nr:cation:proton antiporter [Bacteroidales bacterium]